ncbi:MAG: helix-turn-helix transcriptional regulator [Clostridia bacterium]|nr:helix-turn-helix transcriptional regulator [Clostridia bacterium]
MTTRRELEVLMKLLMKKAKAKYGSLEKISWKTGISTKSLHRYEIGEVLPSLETYAMLCECIGGRCYSEKSDSDLIFCKKIKQSVRFVQTIEKMPKR